jgi:hypothetical protein
MNRLQAQAMNAELNAAVEAILKKNGLDSPKTSLRFTADGDITFTLRASTEASKVNAVKLYAPLHGFTEAQLKKSFTLAGKTLRVTNYNSRAHKMPWVCEDSKGVSYKVTTEQLKRALAK